MWCDESQARIFALSKSSQGLENDKGKKLLNLIYTILKGAKSDDKQASKQQAARHIVLHLSAYFNFFTF